MTEALDEAGERTGATSRTEALRNAIKVSKALIDHPREQFELVEGVLLIGAPRPAQFFPQIEPLIIKP